MSNEQHIYLFGQIQTSQTRCQVNNDTFPMVSVLWMSSGINYGPCYGRRLITYCVVVTENEDIFCFSRLSCFLLIHLPYIVQGGSQLSTI